MILSLDLFYFMLTSFILGVLKLIDVIDFTWLEALMPILLYTTGFIPILIYTMIIKVPMGITIKNEVIWIRQKEENNDRSK